MTRTSGLHSRLPLCTSIHYCFTHCAELHFFLFPSQCILHPPLIVPLSPYFLKLYIHNDHYLGFIPIIQWFLPFWDQCWESCKSYTLLPRKIHLHHFYIQIWGCTNHSQSIQAPDIKNSHYSMYSNNQQAWRKIKYCYITQNCLIDKPRLLFWYLCVL